MPVFKKFKWLLLSIILTGIILITDQGLLSTDHFRKITRHIQKVVNEKETGLESLLVGIENTLKDENFDQWIEFQAAETEKILTANNFSVFIYRNDSLKYWSDNTLPLSTRFNTSDIDKKLFFSGNSWFVTNVHQINNLIIAGLIRIKNEYSYENNFLKNDFPNEFGVQGNWQILTEEGRYNISDNEGDFLFSLKKANNALGAMDLSLSAFLVFAVILSLLLFIYQLLDNQKVAKSLNLLSIICILIIFTARSLMILFKFPDILYSQVLFDPQYLGISSWFPSLGDLLLNSVLLFFASILFYRFIRIKPQVILSPAGKTVVSWLLIFLVMLIFGFVLSLISGLILHSVIPFELFRIFDLNIYTFVGFIIICLLLGTFVLILDKAVCIYVDFLGFRKFIALYGSISILIFVIAVIVSGAMNWYTLIFFYPALVLNSFVRYKNNRFNYSGKILYLFIISAFILVVIFAKSSEKEQNIKKVLAISLANERDPVAELLINELETKLKSDTFIISHVKQDNFNKNLIYEYIRNNYLEGYWNKYDVQLFFCSETDSIEVQPDNISQNCRQFFDDIVRSKGSSIQNTGFYFIDNFNGRINYLGNVGFSPVGSGKISLFIDFNSKLITKELGYPELLLDGRLTRISSIRDYSYAKYKDNVLIAQSGEFQYSLSGNVLCRGKREFSSLTMGDYDHFIYNAGSNYSIVLSKPGIKPLDLLISLSYILVFFHIFFTLATFVCRFPSNIRNFTFGFSNKIRLTMVTVLLVSLLLVGSGTVYYYIKQIENKNIENLDEKIQSVLVEMEEKFGNETQPDSLKVDMTPLLIRLSNIFYTDINVYSMKGMLIASSRPEIYEKALTGTQMNMQAYRQLGYFRLARFIHDEKIGEMKYLSAYVPLINNNNRVLAYLNLPYFTKQSLLKREISALVVAVVNIYVLLILITIVVAVIISNKITRPLHLIQEKVKTIHLQKQNEPILYSSNDEIGSLINDYNRMVVELARSAELLARSERETAWREMAKQIAHEIKNPLTPMKLNIQYLQKAWKERSPDWEENFGKVSRNLIEQIDSLSDIAVEFSHFAKLPKPKIQEVEMTGILENVLVLFKNESRHIHFELINDIPGSAQNIFADKEQIQRVFINLIKNAIQSIPEHKQGEIRIIAETVEDHLNISVVDNGTGIPDELRNRIFEPNFTTKSGGMGLGLAIARSIVEDTGGTIRFETGEGGSSFIVMLPLNKIH
jgi:signal transduction histidine kinase